MFQNHQTKNNILSKTRQIKIPMMLIILCHAKNFGLPARARAYKTSQIIMNQIQNVVHKTVQQQKLKQGKIMKWRLTTN